jgi:hypothetical protein
MPPPRIAVIVTVGDSIPEGALSTNNGAFAPDACDRFGGWTPGRSPQQVVGGQCGDRRQPPAASWRRVTARWRGWTATCWACRGVKAVIVLERASTIIGRGFTTIGPQEPVTLEALIAANKQIHRTLPRPGHQGLGRAADTVPGRRLCLTGGASRVRTGLNNWIRTSGAFDGVIDFATATADKSNPLTFAAEYNLRDKLHPNDAGYQAMADAVDLGWFK